MSSPTPKRTTQRGREIREFLIREVANHPRDLVRVACRKFNISRQAIHRYIRELIDSDLIRAEGKTKRRRYAYKEILKKRFEEPLSGLQEDRVWRNRIESLLENLPDNVLEIWQYAFTEMVNNAIDHSAGNRLTISIEMNAVSTEIMIRDDGVGIFRKIRDECDLEDERHAVLELAKGKLTTDPRRHTGEGIFFTSRTMDRFTILSGDVFFSHTFGQEEDWIGERDRPDRGTSVFMSLINLSRRTIKEIFDQFTADDANFGFNKTVVPVSLAIHGEERLISRSQAKRLLNRLECFMVVLFDFSDVDSIGQAFADEIFRVFARSHPGIELHAVNTCPEVDRMIRRARGDGSADRDSLD